ncbi:MAG: hypothetical protein M3371_08845 [Acidobacteriota bacterium]|nr:hypothetical protein [Acidobacteriota bacterium]
MKRKVSTLWLTVVFAALCTAIFGSTLCATALAQGPITTNLSSVPVAARDACRRRAAQEFGTGMRNVSITGLRLDRSALRTLYVKNIRSTQTATCVVDPRNYSVASFERSGAPGGASASFVNKVWRVSRSSSVAPGTLYVFLSEGTLVITSPNSRPALGTWKYEGGALTMVEEGIPYKTDILRLNKDEFRIRSNNPGGAVEITLVPAEGQP